MPGLLAAVEAGKVVLLIGYLQKVKPERKIKKINLTQIFKLQSTFILAKKKEKKKENPGHPWSKTLIRDLQHR